ncbi:MAG: zf-HC2 domain-containing protein [Anaerolineales bacterium]
MSEHVLDWIGAYYDGELHGDRLRRVEAHLHACAACQAELAALQGLSARLQGSPPRPARTPPEQFVAQVGLRLAPRSAAEESRLRLRQAAGLWLPLGVVTLWAFGQAVLLVSGLVLWVVALPPLPGFGPLAVLAGLLGPDGWGGWLGLLALNAGLTVAACVLVWGCLAAWWAARTAGLETSLASSGEQAGG